MLFLEYSINIGTSLSSSIGTQPVFINDLFTPCPNLSSVKPLANRSNKSVMPCNISGLGGLKTGTVRSRTSFFISSAYTLLNASKLSTILAPLKFLVWALSGPFTTKSKTWRTPVIFGGKHAICTPNSLITSSTIDVLWHPQLSNHIIGFPNLSFIGFITVSNHMIILTVSFHALYWLVITWPVSLCMI